MRQSDGFEAIARHRHDLASRQDYWIQFYDGNGKQTRMSSKSTDPQKAEIMLHKKIGQVDEGINPDQRNLRDEDIRRSYLLKRMAGKNRGFPCRRDGSFVLGDDKLPKISSVTRLDGFFAV
jgi:hypothetical protein